MAVILINEQKKKGHINPEIQGQFSEHLGRGIYEGLFVRPDSGIENVNGMRTDVVNALKEMKVPLLRWPGGCFADEYHWMGSDLWNPVKRSSTPTGEEFWRTTASEHMNSSIFVKCWAAKPMSMATSAAER